MGLGVGVEASIGVVGQHGNWVAAVGRELHNGCEPRVARERLAGERVVGVISDRSGLWEVWCGRRLLQLPVE